MRHLTAPYKHRKTFVQASNKEKRGETDIYLFYHHLPPDHIQGGSNYL